MKMEKTFLLIGGRGMYRNEMNVGIGDALLCMCVYTI